MIRLYVDVKGGRLELDKKHLKATFRAAGSEITALARQLIATSPATGRVYGGHKASAPGEPPANRRGELAAKIKPAVYKSGEGVAVRATAQSLRGSHAPYALFLEMGAKGGRGSGFRGVKGKANRRGGVSSGRVLEPRPFLTAALAQKEASIALRIKRSINDGMKFVKQKA